MKNCPACHTPNDPSNRFCQQCGQALDSVVLVAGPPSPALSQTAILHRATRVQKPHQSASLDALFAINPKLVIGRAPDCDICLQHPTVSRYHALLERTPEGLKLTDLGSVNGLYLDGKRISQPILLGEHQRVGIGPFLFTLIGNTIHSIDSSRSLRLEARVLEKEVLVGRGQKRKLLDNINLVVDPGEFVCLLGPSGSGKSTLMDCLNGRRRATAGQVLANGEDFYQHFDNFRQSLGYVPQKDIVHTQLSVYRALSYTASLRLPTDTDQSERDSRVEEVLREMELVANRSTLVGQLSGGQIKRVSLGAELLARPCLLYIDEATSGLDAGTEARMMRLFRQLADEGRSLICITHNVDNVDQCHLVLLLNRGKLVFYGPPSELPAYFGVKRVSEVYDRLLDQSPEAWEQDFRQSSLYEEYVAKRLAEGLRPTLADEVDPEPEVPELPARLQVFLNNLGGAAAALPSKFPLLAQRLHELTEAAERARKLVRPASEAWHQFKILTRRYTELILSDRRSVRLLLLQAPIVALFVLLGFFDRPYESLIPTTRHLTREERQALLGLRGILMTVHDQTELTPEEQQLLKSIQVPGPTGPISAARALEEFDRVHLIDILLDSPQPVVPYDMMVNPTYTYMLLYIIVIAIFWFGCSNAAKEIVKESSIYSRERAVNLQIVPYLASKFLVLSVICAVQTLLLMVVIYGALEGLHLALHHDLPPAAYRLSYLPQYCLLLLLSLSGVALGLLLSACVTTPDQANALLPYVFIPQMILGGGVIMVKEGVLLWLAMATSPIYWCYRGVRRGVPEMPVTSPFHIDYSDNIWLAGAAIVVQMVVLLGLTAWFLRRQDVLER